MCDTTTVLGCEVCSDAQVSHEFPIGVDLGWNLFSNKQVVSKLLILCLGKEGRHLGN